MPDEQSHPSFTPKVKQLSEDLHECFETKISELEKKTEDLKGEKSDLTEEINRLKEQTQSQQKEISHLTEAYEEMQGITERTVKTLELVTEEVDRIEERLDKGTYDEEDPPERGGPSKVKTKSKGTSSLTSSSFPYTEFSDQIYDFSPPLRPRYVPGMRQYANPLASISPSPPPGHDPIPKRRNLALEKLIQATEARLQKAKSRLYKLAHHPVSPFYPNYHTKSYDSIPVLTLPPPILSANEPIRTHETVLDIKINPVEPPPPPTLALKTMAMINATLAMSTTTSPPRQEGATRWGISESGFIPLPQLPPSPAFNESALWRRFREGQLSTLAGPSSSPLAPPHDTSRQDDEQRRKRLIQVHKERSELEELKRKLLRAETRGNAYRAERDTYKAQVEQLQNAMTGIGKEEDEGEKGKGKEKADDLQEGEQGVQGEEDEDETERRKRVVEEAAQGLKERGCGPS